MQYHKKTILSLFILLSSSIAYNFCAIQATIGEPKIVEQNKSEFDKLSSEQQKQVIKLLQIIKSKPLNSKSKLLRKLEYGATGLALGITTAALLNLDLVDKFFDDSNNIIGNLIQPKYNEYTLIFKFLATALLTGTGYELALTIIGECLLKDKNEAEEKLKNIYKTLN